jgi:hypothetical protein
MKTQPRIKPVNATAASRVLAKQRQLRAVELSATGMTEAGIARLLGVSQPAVHKMLKRACKEALDRLQDLVLRMKAKQDYQLRMLFRETWLCWERSFANDDHPNLHYMDEMLAILADQRKLWGLDGTVQAGRSTAIQENQFDVALADLPLNLIEQILDHQMNRSNGDNPGELVPVGTGTDNG